MNKNLIYFLFIVNLLIICGFWWNYSGALLSIGGPSIFIALGRLTGLLAVYFILIQFLLMGRSSWLEGTFGLDKLSRIHRLNGYLSLIFILTHPLFISIGYMYLTNRSFIEQEIAFL